MPHEECDYEEKNGGEAPMHVETNDVIVATSDCPTCKGTTTQMGTRTTVSDQAIQMNEVKRLTFLCDCRQEHEGRDPEEREKGCGTLWEGVSDDAGANA